MYEMGFKCRNLNTSSRSVSSVRVRVCVWCSSSFYANRKMILNRNDVLLHSLVRYFKQHPSHALQLYDVVSYKSSISLRLLDWLVTNYAKNRNVCYSVRGKEFNLFLSYKSHLKAFSKRAFDPFARRNRIVVHVHPLHPDQIPLQTTVAQLNFFRWCFMHDVLEYALCHEEPLNQDMVQAIRHRGGGSAAAAASSVSTDPVDDDVVPPPSKPRRRELSKNNTTTHVRIGVLTPLV